MEVLLIMGPSTSSNPAVLLYKVRTFESSESSGSYENSESFEGLLVLTYLIGNYTQYPNTTFGAYNLDNTKNRRTNLVVTGSAHIDGMFSSISLLVLG